MILLRKILRPLLLTCAFITAAWLLLPRPPLLDGISFSQCVRDRNGKLLRLTLSADQKFRIWTPLKKISPDLIKATLRYEDKYYARHPGVNPIRMAPIVPRVSSQPLLGAAMTGFTRNALRDFYSLGQLTARNRLERRVANCACWTAHRITQIQRPGNALRPRRLQRSERAGVVIIILRPDDVLVPVVSGPAVTTTRAAAPFAEELRWAKARIGPLGAGTNGR